MIVPPTLPVVRGFFRTPTAPMVHPSTASRDSPTSRTIFRVAFLRPRGSTIMRVVTYLSGMSARLRAKATRASTPHYPFRSSSTLTSVPIGSPTAVTPSSSATRTPTFSRRDLSSTVGVCVFVVVTRRSWRGLVTKPMSSNSRQSKLVASIVLGLTPRKVERDVVSEGCHSSSLELLSETLHLRPQRKTERRPHKALVVNPAGASHHPGLHGVHRKQRLLCHGT